MTAWGPISLNGYRKLNTPKADIGFGLMISAQRTSTSWSLEDINVCFHTQCSNENLDSDSAQFCQRLSSIRVTLKKSSFLGKMFFGGMQAKDEM